MPQVLRRCLIRFKVGTKVAYNFFLYNSPAENSVLQVMGDTLSGSSWAVFV